MSSRPTPRATQRGLSLIELVLAVVIIGVGLAGLLSVFSLVVGRSADPVTELQLQALAEELMEEIVLRPFAPAANAAPSGCARDTFNDIHDYHGYSTTDRICAVDGTEIPSLSGYSIAVTVNGGTLGGVAAARLIVVTVRHGSASFVLQGWRTDYAS